DVLGTLYPSLEPVDSSTPRSAPLSRCTLLRHPSFVRAVCVDAPVRLCAGGDQRWSSLPRQLCRRRGNRQAIYEMRIGSRKQKPRLRPFAALCACSGRPAAGAAGVAASAAAACLLLRVDPPPEWFLSKRRSSGV